MTKALALEIKLARKMARGHMEASKRLQIQLEVVVGNLLGDGSLITYAKQKLPKGYAMQLCSSHREYIDHLRNIYANWTRASTYDKHLRKDGTRRCSQDGQPLDPHWAFITRSQTCLKSFGDWHLNPLQGVRKKLPPYDKLKDLLTPRAVAYWYMDDGHLDKTIGRFFFSTDGFTKEESALLCDLLWQKYQIKCYISYISAKDQWRICGKKVEFPGLRDLVKPYIIPCFAYKVK